MGLFWTYFRDKLAWPLIHRPGPLAALVEGAAFLLDECRTHILWLRDQFLAERCEDSYLPQFARSRGIVRAPLETVEHWQSRVRFAYQFWAKGGRSAQMASMLMKYFGFAAVTVTNLRNEDPARWAEFKVTARIGGQSLLFTDQQILWAINETKPARSKLAEVVYTYAVSGDVPVFALLIQSGEIIEVYPEG